MKQQRKRQRRQAGVTLIEMLVVVTIIALFAALVAPSMFKQGDKARVAATHAQINNFEDRAGAVQARHRRLPDHRAGPGGAARPPANVAQWDGPYLQKDIPNDPWGHPYVYKFPGEHGDEPDIMSLWRGRAAGRRRDQCRHRQLETVGAASRSSR